MAKRPARKRPAKAPIPKTRKRAKVKSTPKRVAADAKAAIGVLPQWTIAEIEEAFRRFKGANPEPKGELQHLNSFTLLVAVVLSAQATDAGVNKATPALFALADTPEKMVALGETRVRELIKTIGLFRTKAKNVIALSRKLVTENGGQVPLSRRQPYRNGHRQDAVRGRNEIESSRSGRVQAPRPPLAYSARALHLRGAQAAVRKVHHQRPV
jgi:endonuclease-3